MNSLFQFLNNGLKETLPVMGNEIELTYEGKKIPGIYNEKTYKDEMDFSGKTLKRETTFLMRNIKLNELSVTIVKNKKATISGITYKITEIIDGPVTTMVVLGLVNDAKLPA